MGVVGGAHARVAAGERRVLPFQEVLAYASPGSLSVRVTVKLRRPAHGRNSNVNPQIRCVVHSVRSGDTYGCFRRVQSFLGLKASAALLLAWKRCK